MVFPSVRSHLVALLLGAALLAPVLAQTVLRLPAAAAPAADLRHALAVAPGKALRLESLPLGASGAELASADLRRTNAGDTAPLLVVHTGSEVTQTRPAPRAHFTGQLVGDPQSSVFMSIDSQGAMRSIVRRGEEVFVSDMPAPNAASAVGAASPSLSRLRSRRVEFTADAPAKPFVCGVNDEFIEKHYVPPSAALLENLRNNHQRAGLRGAAAQGPEALGVQRRADIIIETDYELFQLLGSSAAVHAYVTDLLGYASSQYESEIGARLNLTQIHVYASPADPWTGSATDVLLDELQAYWNAPGRSSQARHHVHLLSGRDTGGGVAYVDTLGSASKNYAYGVSGSISGNFSASNPQVVWDSVVVAHEIGHAFGSAHTHSFDNPYVGSSAGGAIDCCYADARGTQCTAQIGGRYRHGVLPGIASITGGSAGSGAGTIMSYCHLLSGNMSNLSFNFGTNHTRGVNPWRVASVLQSSAQTNLPLDSVVQNFALSVSRQGSGSGAVSSTPVGIACGTSCSANFAAGTQVTLAAQAAAGSSFTGWSGACSGTASSCSVSMDSARSVTASFTAAPIQRLITLTKSGTGSGNVTSSPSGLSCAADCGIASSSFASNSAVMLVPQAATGSTFTGWSGACSGTGNCSIAAGTSSASVTASFNANSSGGSGTVTLLNQTNLSSTTSTNANFMVQVPSGASSLVVTTSGGQGDVDLYVKAGATPTLLSNDCASRGIVNTESCSFATPRPGAYYILLNGYGAYSGVTLRVTYRLQSAKVTLSVTKTGTGQGTVLSSSTTAASTPKPTSSQWPTAAIVGGVPAQPGAWPWQVLLSITTNQGTFMCGGSLVSDQWVLTAAHCIEDAGNNTVSPTTVTVRAGSLQKDSGGVVVGVSRIIKHHAYEPATFDNDIALLRLSSPLPLSSTINVVDPLSASQESQLAATNTLATVTGWGTTSPGGNTSASLLQAQVPLLTSSDCTTLSAYSSSQLSNNMICAGYMQGGKDACQGDSGGPLVVSNGQGGHVLAGIVSWGQSCAAPDYPGVYTRVANYQPWLQTHTQLALGAPLLNCGSACSASVDANTTITLRAQASNGSNFAGWSGACSGTANTCTVLLDNARSVTASFSNASSSAYTQQVITLFTGYFGRPAASSGQSYYEGLMEQSGGNFRILVDDFYKSAEAQAIYGGSSVQTQVVQVFDQLFSRMPLDAGLSYWTQQVAQSIISVPEMAYTVAYNASATDNTVLNAKRQAAQAFTKALDSNSQYSTAYRSGQTLGRLYLGCVKSASSADAAIAKLPSTMANMAAGIYTYACP